MKKEGNLYTFQAKHKMENAGSFKVSYRMFPKNADLPHRRGLLLRSLVRIRA
ncbi:hypothetical protein NIB75_14715 [Bacteroides uniformis]|nr:hypothetical protein [Bacteroides uniformis]